MVINNPLSMNLKDYDIKICWHNDTQHRSAFMFIFPPPEAYDYEVFMYTFSFSYKSILKL